MKANLILCPKIKFHLKRLNILGEYKTCIWHVINKMINGSVGCEQMCELI